MAENEWDAEAYDDDYEFVAEYGRELLDLLAPEPGDRVLDVGCGTGELTAEVADSGAEVVGVDAAPEMVERARERHAEPTFVEADIREYTPDRQFDAVFSNAALHWIPEGDHDAVLGTVAEALAPDGRFVAEFGGRGNVATIADALAAELRARGYDADHSWYFPSIGEYAPRLEAHGLEPTAMWLFDRPTDLEGGEAGLEEWLGMFGDEAFADVGAADREAIVEAVEERLRPTLFDAETETWTADYRRIRLVADRK